LYLGLNVIDHLLNFSHLFLNMHFLNVTIYYLYLILNSHQRHSYLFLNIHLLDFLLNDWHSNYIVNASLYGLLLN
jgi:hypothetical protein